jgi:hypothetical protein
MSIHTFLDDLARMRASLDDEPRHERAIRVEEFGRPAVAFVDAVATRGGGQSQCSIHVFSTIRPRRGARSSLAIPVSRADAPAGVSHFEGVVLFGPIEPGRAIVLFLDGQYVWPAGPARHEMRGVKWNG